MPRRNRVTPYGELIVTPARGLVFGNRGCLHDSDGSIRRPWAVTRWIACRLEFRSRQRALVQPGRYTELFFLDEATALAAGHRPCAECRHADYRRFADRFPAANAGTIDARLHAERLNPDGSRRLHPMPAVELPDGAMIDLDGAAWLVLGDHICRWTPAGYTDTEPRPDGTARVVTPRSLVAALADDWRSVLRLVHPSAR